MNSAMVHAPSAKMPRGSASEDDRYGIIVFSHLRWKFVWQRPQQFLSRLAKNHPVLFVELTDFDLAEGQEPRLELYEAMTGVTVANIHMPPSLAGSPQVDDLMARFTHEAVRRIDSGSFSNPLLWFYSPMDSHWALPAIQGRAIVYDCMDELSQFNGASPELVDREAELMRQADIVFTGGHQLWLKKKKLHPNVHFFGCGVEYDHFSQAQQASTVIPDDLARIPEPRVGWFGVVDERVDYNLLREMAQMRPEYQFVLVGPVVKVDPASLPQAPNLHWLGGRDYQELPAYCRGFNVCMMCFALNEATEFINPTKALEYLATGKPVVSTAVPDVVSQYSDTVEVAHDIYEFVEAVDGAIRHPDTAKIARGIARARKCSWESTVDQMQEIIASAMQGRR